MTLDFIENHRQKYYCTFRAGFSWCEVLDLG